VAKIDSVFDFSDKALVELKSWLEPWFKSKDSNCECVPAPPTGDTIDAIILGLGPDAWWKLDETTGVIAHDSSGNSHDLTASAGYSSPAWAQAAGPPGTTTAGWTTTSNTGFTGALTAFTDNFTAGIWVYVTAVPVFTGEILGQGTAQHSGTGWALTMLANSGTTVDETFMFIVNGTPYTANNPFSLNTWYFLALVRDSGTWKLYVNGLLQAATATTSPGSAYGGNTWIGTDAFAAHSTYLRNARLSYGFIFNRVLTGSQLLEIYNSAVLPAGANLGKALITSGLGSTYWDYAASGSGTTGARPTLTANGTALFVGTGYFDTTLGKPIWWNGTVWKDATGTTV